MRSSSMEADVRPDQDRIQTQDTSQPSRPIDHAASHLQAVFSAISAYPFHADSEYQAGLAAILGHPETPVSEEEVRQNSDLVVQAKCFYFTRKHGLAPIDPEGYTTWLQGFSTFQHNPPNPTSTTNTTLQQPPTHPSPTTSQLSPTAAVFKPSSSSSPPKITSSLSQPATIASPTEQPPYPTSFAAIVDLITRNIPVPGIEEIPTTVLEPGSSKVDRTPRRKKPWEEKPNNENDNSVVDDVGGDGELSGADGISAEKQTAAPTPTPTPAATQAGAGENSGGAETSVDPADLNGLRDRKTGSGSGGGGGGDRRGQGVVNILKPNAVPDSGLLAKD